jgi:hypothetical protein
MGSMTSDLRDRLAAVADRAAYDAPSGPPAGELWDRGVRRRGQQRALVSAAVVAVLAGVLAFGAVVAPALPDDARPQPATPVPVEDAVLPDRIVTPPAWMPGTDEVGLPGRLSAVVSAERGGWPVAEPGLAGVSAADGSMAWLDLPDDAAPGPEHEGFIELPLLSPDGSRVAFWTLGETAGTPADEDRPQITGLAVWDVATGVVERHEIATEHGLQPDVLGWLNRDTVLFEAGQIQGGHDQPNRSSMSRFGQLLAWEPGSEPRAVELPRRQGYAQVEDLPGDGTILLTYSTRGDRNAALVNGEGELLTPAVPLGPDVGWIGAFSPSRDRLAAVPGNRNPNHVAVAEVPASGAQAEFRRVPGGGRTFSVLAWLDENRVVVHRRIGEPGEYLRTAIVSQDVRTGERRRLVALPLVNSTGVQAAPQLLDADVVDAPAPDDGTDPRLVAGAGAVSLLAGLVLALTWWRRRAHA